MEFGGDFYVGGDLGYGGCFHGGYLRGKLVLWK